ncbi:hypothetical protein [Helicobacter fennelliae]|uniref:hypothetical protein n=1 Tax=Helicobacter fennelliae TaxID=215 RepID=UPI000DFFD54F|nr:hypothetical protein [Helicobacter fennelliae]STQ83809.1 Uncharacterised protein [Helicobacter fennelliae]
MEVFDIKNRIDFTLVKKIFGNATNGLEFLEKIGQSNILKTKKSQEIFNKIVQIWDYQKATPIIRDIFMRSEKYKRGLDGQNTIKILLDEWQNLGFGNLEWPFSQGAFDNFVQSINSENIDRISKDEKVKNAAVRYRRIKEINTERNDFLESLIFAKNPNIIPTLSHSRGVDFFINGISFDQKVSRSVTNEFKKDFGNKWREKALKEPHLVAQYLYSYQDEGRFGYAPRLFVVYLDEDISPLEVKDIITNTNLKNPLDITFTYKHKDIGNRTYKTQSFVILLSRN